MVVRRSLAPWMLLVMFPRLSSATSHSQPTSSTSQPTEIANVPMVSGSKDSVQKFLSDLDRLRNLQNVAVITPTHSKRDSSFTKSWNLSDWERHQSQCWLRYQRHIVGWFRSTTAAAILPAVATSTAWAALIVLVAQKLQTLDAFIRSASFQTGSLNAPIALLLTLRTNRSLNRLNLVRGQFGTMIRAVTTLSNMAVSYVKEHETALLMGRYLALYGWSVKGVFRNEDIQSLIHTLLPPQEASWLLSSYQNHPATAIVFRLRHLIGGLDLPTAVHQSFEDRLCDLETALGVCKRILGSPIPPTYTRHTSRVLFIYLFLMPLSLLGNASTLAVLLTVFVSSYVSFGLDEISVELEHPFPLLPMYTLVSSMQDNISNQFLLGMNVPSP